MRLCFVIYMQLGLQWYRGLPLRAHGSRQRPNTT
jgi:hypothetical protein